MICASADVHLRLICAVDHTAISAVAENTALVSSQWLRRAWSFPLHTHRTNQKTENSRKYRFFKYSGVTRPGFESNLPVSVARDQPSKNKKILSLLFHCQKWNLVLNSRNNPNSMPEWSKRSLFQNFFFLYHSTASISCFIRNLHMHQDVSRKFTIPKNKCVLVETPDFLFFSKGKAI